MSRLVGRWFLGFNILRLEALQAYKTEINVSFSLMFKWQGENVCMCVSLSFLPVYRFGIRSCLTVNTYR